ncbi:MAG: hypothetical protein WBF89_14575 [Steroidobacteraceae bacterium]
MDPVLGIIGDYATNPALLERAGTAETNGAVLLDAPTTYNGNGFEFFVLPSFRLSNSEGYASMASDYEHLNVKGEFDTDRSTWTMAAGANRDSSLYADYLANGSVGVRRDSLTADLNWDRHLTERLELDTDVDTLQVRFGQAAGISNLTDYKDTSISPTLSWNSSERDKLTLSASVGKYDALDVSSESRSANLQVGFVRQLTEIWSLTANAGYSRALNRLAFNEEFLVETPEGLAIEIVPIKEESSQNGAVYSVDVGRKGERLSFDAIASRTLAPTGYAFLSKQNLVQLTATYTCSARWSFTGSAYYAQAQNPQLQGGIITQTPKNISLSANWRWTEFWTVTLNAARVEDRFQPPGNSIGSSEVSIKISRQFNHIKF